jgi:hypothetical protein
MVAAGLCHTATLEAVRCNINNLPAYLPYLSGTEKFRLVVT